jgi:hypothetical protein
MSQLILKFNLPEEETEANFALKGGEYFLILHELYDKLRNITKYGNNPFNSKTASEQEILLAEQIREYLSEQNIGELLR